MQPSALQFWRRPLLNNALALYAVQGLNYVVPLLMIPYLLRALGPISYGAIVFAQAVVGYAAVVTEYGFNLTAARDISIARGEPEEVARIYWATMAAKLMLLLLSLAAVSAIVAAVPALRERWAVTACCATAALGGVAFPQWYFQGLERLRETAVIQALAKILTAGAVLAFVHRPEDVLAAAFIMSASQLAGVAAALCLGMRVTPRQFRRPTVADVRAALTGGWHMFLSGASITLYGHTNTFVLGLICGEQAVALYNVGFKVVYALQGLVSPVVQAVYPRTSLLFDKAPADAWALIVKVAKLLMPTIASLSVILAIFAPRVVTLIAGPAYGGSVAVLRILCIMPACVTAALLLAQCAMVNLGLTRSLVRIYFIVGVVNLGMLPGLVWAFAQNGAALSLALAEMFGPLLMLRSLHRFRRNGIAWQLAQ